MTCRAMQLRFLSWIWERLEVHLTSGPDLEEAIARKLDGLVNALLANALLAASVRYFFVLLFPWVEADLSSEGS